MFEKMDEMTYKYLLEDPQGCDVISISVKPAGKIIPAGTVMYRNASGMFEAAAASNITAANYLVVLAEDCDTTKSTTIANDAAAYRAARLVRTSVKVGEAAPTAAQEVVLRNQGLVLCPMMSTAEFNNEV